MCGRALHSGVMVDIVIEAKRPIRKRTSGPNESLHNSAAEIP
jgi:hypothetical protein